MSLHGCTWHQRDLGRYLAESRDQYSECQSVDWPSKADSDDVCRLRTTVTSTQPWCSVFFLTENAWVQPSSKVAEQVSRRTRRRGKEVTLRSTRPVSTRSTRPVRTTSTHTRPVRTSAHKGERGHAMQVILAPMAPSHCRGPPEFARSVTRPSRHRTPVTVAWPGQQGDRVPYHLLSVGRERWGLREGRVWNVHGGEQREQAAVQSIPMVTSLSGRSLVVGAWMSRGVTSGRGRRRA